MMHISYTHEYIVTKLNYTLLQFGTFEKFTYQAQQVNHEFKGTVVQQTALTRRTYCGKSESLSRGSVRHEITLHNLAVIKTGSSNYNTNIFPLLIIFQSEK